MYRILNTLLVLAISLTAGNASAFQYHDNDVLVFTWQTSSDKWKACGPVQCTSSSSKTEKKAIGYVINARRHDNLQRIPSEHGKCTVYIDYGSIGAGDYSPKKVLRLANKRC